MGLILAAGHHGASTPSGARKCSSRVPEVRCRRRPAHSKETDKEPNRLPGDEHRSARNSRYNRRHGQDRLRGEVSQKDIGRLMRSTPCHSERMNKIGRIEPFPGSAPVRPRGRASGRRKRRDNRRPSTGPNTVPCPAPERLRAWTQLSIGVDRVSGSVHEAAAPRRGGMRPKRTSREFSRAHDHAPFRSDQRKESQKQSGSSRVLSDDSTWG